MSFLTSLYPYSFQSVFHENSQYFIKIASSNVVDHIFYVVIYLFFIHLSQEKRMMIFAEATAVEDPLVSQDENFLAVRSKLCIFKEGELWLLVLVI